MTDRPAVLDPDQRFDLTGTGDRPRRDLPWRLVGCPWCGVHHYNDEPCPALELVPLGRDPAITALREANDFVEQTHRRHGAKQGYKFAIGAQLGDKLVGVAIVGRPNARLTDDRETLEVTRLATDGTPNACSLLYGAAARAAKALGYRLLVTLTGADELGSSVRAAGFTRAGESTGGSWSRPSRSRDAEDTGPKVRWERVVRDPS